MNVPVVDIGKIGLLIDSESKVKEEDVKKVGDEIYEALSHIGFLYLKNSGVPESEYIRMQSVFKKLFDLDRATKDKCSFGKDLVGYVSPDSEKLEYAGEKDYKEAFIANGKYFLNLDKYSPKLPGFDEEISEYCKTWARLARRLLPALGHGLKLENVNYFMENHTRLNGRDNITSLRCNRYPPVTDDLVDSLDIRLGAHSDYGSFTFVVQDDCGGLQLQNLNGDFIDAPYIPETIVMNVGDIMNLWTEGRLKSTVHRVVIPKDRETRLKERISMAYFVYADDDVMIDPPKYSEEASQPKRDKMLFDPSIGTQTSLDWCMYKFYKARGMNYDRQMDQNK